MSKARQAVLVALLLLVALVDFTGRVLSVAVDLGLVAIICCVLWPELFNRLRQKA